MSSTKKSYLHKVFFLQDNGSRKYFLVTGYNKIKDIYDVIECYPDGEPMTSGYQGKVLASNMKNVNFIDLPKNIDKEEPYELTQTSFQKVTIPLKDPKKEDIKKEVETSKEEDPTILSWRRMSLRY